MRLRHLLPLAMLLLFAPFVQAHESHDAGRAGVHAEQVIRAELAASAEVASATAPCGNHGAGTCCCSNACCYSPNLVKLPAIQESRLFRVQSDLPSALFFISIQSPRAVSPIIALAAPRAPPLPQ